MNALNMKVEELVRSNVEKDAEAGKELSSKMKSLSGQFDKLTATVEKRIKIGANNVSFQKRVKQVENGYQIRGRVTMTTEITKRVAVTSSRINAA